MAIVRRMTSEDLGQVSALEAAIFSMPWSRAGFAASLEKEDNIFLVAEEEGKIVGYCGMIVSIDEGEITNVAVAEEARQKGIGNALMEEIIRQGSARGVTRIVLEVRVSNSNAIHLYQRHHFITAGMRKGFYERPKEDAYIMIYGQ